MFISSFAPSFVFAMNKQTFSVSQNFRSSGGIDLDFTAAWYDKSGKRVVSVRDYAVNEVSSLALDSFACDPAALRSQASLQQVLTTNVGCKVTANGTLLFGFFRDPGSLQWIGRIYRVQGSSAQKISSDNFFSDTRAGRFFIGVKNSDDLFVINTLRNPRFFRFISGSWSEITPPGELANIRASSRLMIAWGGNAWFFSSGGRDLRYFDGQLLVEAYGQVPLLNFSIKRLETDIAGNSLLIFNAMQALRVRDNGYQPSLIVESKTIRSKSGDPIIEVTFAPNAATPPQTSIEYFISTNNGDRWQSVSPNQRITTLGKDTNLRWQGLLHSSNPNQTPIVTGVTLTYATDDTTGKRAISRDSERARDIKTVEKFLRAYFDQVHRDPLGESGLLAPRRWDILKQSLVSQAREHRSFFSVWRNIERNFPEEPQNVSDAFLYDYHTDPSGSSFLLSVKLERSSSRALQSDIDGLVLGVNCNDPVFCLGAGPAVRQERITLPNFEHRLMRASGDYKVYLVQRGRKHWIVSEQSFLRRRYRWDDILIVTPEERDTFATGSSLR